ncbi:MAG: universal stress protein [Leptolyngbyaceae cyanobacterium MO_188.B28]|nr:universal stress protein [Leptolyngbyaceae cyanobacterium MO_188.B28]
MADLRANGGSSALWVKIEEGVIMLQKILVALDDSAIGEQVFNEALCLAKATGARLMLLHVLSMDEKGSPDTAFLPNPDASDFTIDRSVTAYLEQLEAFKTAGLNRLREQANAAQLTGVPTEFTQTLGAPGYGICDLARTWGADLIITGRRSRSLVNKLFLGSVSNYVIHNAPCSVMTIHSQDDKSIAK